MKSLGELLIFAMLIVTNGRVFFVQSRKDGIVVLSPLSFFLSILQIISWGLDIFTGAALIMSILVLLSNFHAIYRYFEHLYVDHYSILMYVWAVSTCLICAVCFIFTFIFRTPKFNFAQYDVNIEVSRYTGNFSTGFRSAGIFEKNSAVLTRISPESEASGKNTTVLFIPDKRGNTYHYMPYLVQLASKGYDVYCAEFYSKDCRWLHSVADSKLFRRSTMILQSLINNWKFNSQKEFYYYNVSLEIPALVKIAEETSGKLNSENTKYFIITDFMGRSAASDYEKLHKDSVAGTFCLEDISSYKTAGYGFIDQTDRLLVKMLGLELDKNTDYAKLAAVQTANYIEAQSENNL